MMLSEKLSKALTELGTDENIQKIFKLPRPNAVNITISRTNKGLSINGAYIFKQRDMGDFYSFNNAVDYLMDWLTQREFPEGTTIVTNENRIKISTILPE